MVRRLLIASLALVAVAALHPASLPGQSQSVPQIKAQAGTAAIPTLHSIGQAERAQDYTAVQLRRFRDDNGGLTTVRERLEIDADGSADPRFRLTFLTVEGQPPGSTVNTQWQQTYARYAELFVRRGGFHIRDVAKAVSNYSLHDFGPVLRANRSARRMVVFPNVADKAIWLIDVDVQTRVPLFVAEFDVQLQLLAEVEVVSFAPAVTPIPSTSPVGVTIVPTFASALGLLGALGGIVDPDTTVVSEYGVDRIEVRDDPLNGQQKLVISYTDGVDQFSITQEVNALNPFASLPGGGTGGHTIARFRDPAVSALFFWHDGTSVHIAGRGALRRLDDFARQVYRQILVHD